MDGIRRLLEYLTQNIVEREEAMRGLVLALGARQHVLFIGPPGTAKSLAVRVFAAALDGRPFVILMNPFLTPEDFLGPIDVGGLKQGRYEHVTSGMLPESTVAFFDEVFKANATVNNLLLMILQERCFTNGGRLVKVPLQVAVAASNELPGEDQRDQAAFADRFLLRYTVDYVREPQNFERLLATDPDALIRDVPRVSRDEVEEYQRATDSVGVTGEVLRALAVIRDECMKAGLVFSDRRYREGLTVVRANAALEGRGTAELCDLDVYRHILWHEPGQIGTAAKIVMNAVDPYLVEIEEAVLEAREVARAALEAPQERSADAGLEAHKKLKRIGEELEKICPNTLRGRERLDSARAEVKRLLGEVLKKCLGLEL
ncbi:MAG: AAA family ATPase [Bacillota bacterium]